MIILALRTDKPDSELYLFDGDTQLKSITWQAHRKLAETLHVTIDKLLAESSKSLNDVEGIVIYEGPGSFTGLRIGMSVANALHFSLNVPIIACGGKDWLKTGRKKLQAGKDDPIALPLYGSPVRTTTQKH